MDPRYQPCASRESPTEYSKTYDGPSPHNLTGAVFHETHLPPLSYRYQELSLSKADDCAYPSPAYDKRLLFHKNVPHRINRFGWGRPTTLILSKHNLIPRPSETVHVINTPWPLPGPQDTLLARTTKTTSHLNCLPWL